MGIENFFNTLRKANFIQKNNIDNINLNTDYLYIDFNSVIYMVVDECEEDINYYLYSIIIKNYDEKCKVIEDKYKINFNTIDEFTDYFNQKKVDEIVKENIYNFIKNLCIKVNKDTLKEIFISFDGTPTFSKISDKRKRKYLNHIINNFKSDVYHKYSNTIDKDRELFYKNKISFSTNNPNRYNCNWSGHLEEIYFNLNSNKFRDEIKDLCKNLIDIKISYIDEFGEGEKKIIEHIMQNKKKGQYIIYSPDSDILLLSIIINNKFERLNIDSYIDIIKYEPNKKIIEIISIKNLIDNIYNYIFSKLNLFRKQHNIKLNIIDDIVGIITFFGNDFLPKIESINMKNGLEILFTQYAKVISYCRLSNPYLLYTENNKTKINMYLFSSLIEKLSEVEDKLMFDNYIQSEYKNFNYLSKIFGCNEYTPFFIDKLNRYCHGFNKIIRYIKLNPYKTAEEVYKNIIEKFTDKDNWEKIFISIESNITDTDNNTNIMNILNNLILSIRENKKYKLGLKLIKYSDDINDKFHQNNISDNFIHPLMIISEYDKEIYKLEKRMNEYKNISLNTEDKIGNVELKYKFNEYKIHTDINIINKKDYFYKDIVKLESTEINKFCEEYIKGFFWTIDFYFNKIDRNININNISIWSYEYTHTPYFKEIYNIMNRSDKLYNMYNLYNSISDINSNYYVSPSKYMNTLEQYLYITPKNVLQNNIPEVYKDILNDSNLFIEIETFYKKIIDNINGINNVDNNINLLESYNTNSINKLNIIGFKKSSYYDFMSKILPLRQH
jgi:hypothetical protein